MCNIILSPLFNHYMSGRIWMGLDIDKLKRELIDKYQHSVKVIPFNQLVKQLNEIPKKAVLFYSTIYQPKYLQYIRDTVVFISQIRPDIILMPNQEQLHSFENKGVQEYYKKIHGIDSLQGKYYGDIDELIDDSERMPFPFVLKKNEGALSIGVFLAKDKNTLIDFSKKWKKMTLKEKLAYKLNRKNSFKRDTNLKPVLHLLEKNFDIFFEKRIPVITQQFVAGLDGDFKVLVFGDKYYVLKRKIRKNDFRASGSGNFLWEDQPQEVLDFAKEVTTKLNVPFISLDIGVDNNGTCYLFEYQGTAFGPMTLTASERYFVYKKEEWKKIEEKSNLEKEYAYAIDYFLRHENN